jgi:Cof subfamily protein (haloacid dehalogenase superfamily)
MPVRLIALDIDGTLLDSRFQVSPANHAAIAAATARGIEVALVTGRRYDFARQVSQTIDSPLTMIVNNGAIIRTNTGHTHVRHLLARNTAAKVLELTKPWREAASVIFDRSGPRQIFLESLGENDGWRSAYYSRNRESIAFADPLESSLTEDPIQLMFAGSIAACAEIEKALRAVPFAQEFALGVTVYAKKDFSMIDVINPVCSKGSSLREWAELQCIAREEVLAIGDNHNDLEMLHFAGIPVVMANSVQELKKFGWHETTSNDCDGVANAIEHFALGEAASCA